MNAVAMTNVATVTTLSFGSQQSSGPKVQNSFDNVYNKTLEAHRKLDTKSLKKTPVEAKTTEYGRMKDEKIGLDSNLPEDVETDAVTKVDSPDEVEQTLEGAKLADAEEGNKEEIQAMVDEVLKKVADALEISQDELGKVMAALNIGFMDLFQNETVKMLVSEVLGLSNESQLLTQPSAINLFKDVTQIMDLAQEAFNNMEEGMSLESLEDLIKAVDPTQSSKQDKVTAKETKVQDQGVNTETGTDSTENTESTQVPKVTIADERTNDEPKNLRDADSKNESDQSKANGQQTIDPTQLFSNEILKKAHGMKVTGDKAVNMIPAQEILDQIVTGAKITLTDKATTMFVQLQPENLGKIAFSIASENGSLTGHFVAENTAVKETIEANLVHLKTNLIEQGIKVDEIKVVVGNTDQYFSKQDGAREQQQQPKNKRRKVNMDVLSGIEQKIQSLEESLKALGIDSNHSIEFSA